MREGTHPGGTLMDAALDRRKVKELLDLTQGDAGWVRDLLQTYVDDTRERLTELTRVTHQGVADRIQRSAHGIKGSSSNIGASHMADLCQQMEHLARDGQTAALTAQLDAMEAEFLRIQADIPLALSGR